MARCCHCRHQGQAKGTEVATELLLLYSTAEAERYVSNKISPNWDLILWERDDDDDGKWNQLASQHQCHSILVDSLRG